MYYYIEQAAQQREMELARRSRSGLFAQQRELQLARAGRAHRSQRSERGGVHLRPLSFGKWRHWGARPTEIRCNRADAWAGGC